MQEGTLEYIFFSKHYELLKETIFPQSISEEKKDVNKTPNSLYSKEEDAAEETKSPTVVKHKLMSLLTLVKEYTKGKKSKNKNNCSECLKLGSA